MLDRQNPRHDLMGGLQALRVVAHGSRLVCQRGDGGLDTQRGRVVYRLGEDAADQPHVRHNPRDPPCRDFETGRLEGLSKVSVAAAFFFVCESHGAGTEHRL